VSPSDPWVEALKIANAPKNLCQAVQREKGEEAPLTQLPVIDQKNANHLRELIQNDTPPNKH
jgi:Holliday junction resolvasome RuvABC DNA-binding subunit